MGSIEIDWDGHSGASTPTEQIAIILSLVDRIREFVYTELRDLTNLSVDSAATVESYLEGQLRVGWELEAGEDVESEAEAEAEAEVENEKNGEDPFGDAPDAVTVPLNGMSPSERQVVIGRLSFLAQLRKDLLEAKSASALLDMLRMVTDEVKPGILIDGQHRVMGTKALGDIPFLVTALPLSGWSELAFQFIVTNRTAKRVPESLLISIIGNSLSKTQRSSIEGRLRDAGIRVGLIDAVMRVHEDEQSPFYELLSFGLKGERGFLDAAAMQRKVIQPWYERKVEVQYLFDHLCEGKRKNDRTEYWKSEELWFEYFVAFWSAVRARYEGSNVFSDELEDVAKKRPYSKLMSATVLMIFQGAVLKRLQDVYKGLESSQKIPVATYIKDEASFMEVVKNTLQKLTPDFFTGWKLSGFDGSKEVQNDLQEAILLVVSEKKTVAQLKNQSKQPHRLFKV
jgi:hypothetical protein